MTVHSMNASPVGGALGSRSWARSQAKEKAVMSTLGSASAPSTSASHCGGSAVSAWSTRITSPVARRTPALTAGPRPPREVVRASCSPGVTSSLTSSMVRSRQPASTTTSWMRSRRAAFCWSVSRQRPMLCSSLNAGTTTEMVWRGRAGALGGCCAPATLLARRIRASKKPTWRSMKDCTATTRTKSRIVRSGRGKSETAKVKSASRETNARESEARSADGIDSRVTGTPPRGGATRARRQGRGGHDDKYVFFTARAPS